VPDFIDQITTKYLEERENSESFKDYIQRIGKKELKNLVDKLSAVPPYALDRSYYSDWRDPREFTVSDIGTGECAGEVVSMIDFDLQAAEREYFEAQLKFDDGKYQEADEQAYKAMLYAAKGLVRIQYQDITDKPDQIVGEFKTRFYDTGIFQDKYAGGKFAEYLFNRHHDKERKYSKDNTRHLIEETQLFIEAAHACNLKLTEKQNPVAAKIASKETTASSV